MDRQDSLVGINGASVSRPLKLSANAKTDISRFGEDPNKPSIRFSSPILRVAMPTSSFRRVRTTFKATRGFAHHWDQAGIIFVWPTPKLPAPDAAHPGTEESAPLYVKAGIENVNGTPMVASLANNGELDFSSMPLEKGEDVGGLTLEAVKYGEKLLIIVIRKGSDGKETKVLHRAIYWGLKQDTEREVLWVGLFSSRPDWGSDAPGPLEIDIDHFEVEDVNGTVQFA